MNMQSPSEVQQSKLKKEKDLWNAVNNQEWTTVLALLKEGVSTNVNDEKNSIFSIVKTKNSDHEYPIAYIWIILRRILDYIHKAGVSKIPYSDRNRIFTKAAAYGKHELVSDMLAQDPSHLSNEAKEIALRNAAENEEWTIVSILLKAGVSTKVNDEKNSIFAIKDITDIDFEDRIEKILDCIHEAGVSNIPAKDRDNIFGLSAGFDKHNSHLRC